MSKSRSRAELAGVHLAKSIIEIAHLMYQNNTKKNFYSGLIRTLEKARNENKD